MPRRAAAVTVAASATENNSERDDLSDSELLSLPRFKSHALFALHSCGRSTRKLRNAITAIENASVTRTADWWTPNTTHLVLPSLSRNVKLVCVLAGGGQLVRPNFIDLVKRLDYVPSDVPPDYGWDLSKQDAPRYHPDAANVWRRRRAEGRGGVLRGMRVFVVGELVPKRARGADGLISTTMAEAILEAAGAVVLSSPEDADFALLTDVEIEKKHPAIPQLRNAEVPCFGPAILTDLIRRVEIKPTEFLAFKDQAALCEKFVSAYDAEHAEVVPILLPRSSVTSPSDEALSSEQTSSPRKKPKSSSAVRQSPVAPDRKLANKTRTKASPRSKISKRRSVTNSRVRNLDRSGRSVSAKTVDKQFIEDNFVSPNGKRPVSAVPVHLKLHIKRPRRKASDQHSTVHDTTTTALSACAPVASAVSIPTHERASAISLTVNDANQLGHTVKPHNASVKYASTDTRRNSEGLAEDGSTPPEAQSSQPDPVSLLLSLAKSPGSAPVPPNVKQPANNASIPFSGSVAPPLFHEPSPQLMIRPQLTPKVPSIPVLPQSAVPQFVLPPPSPTVPMQLSPSVPRIGLSPIGPLSLPPISSRPLNANGSLSTRIPQLGGLPPDGVMNNGAPSSLFSPVPDRQGVSASDYATLLAPLATSQPPFLGTPLHTPRAISSMESPRKRKSVGDAADASPATPENIDESPMKRRRPNRNGAPVMRLPLDFRLAHGAQKALSQTRNEPSASGSASTVRPSSVVVEDVSGGSGSVVRDLRITHSVPVQIGSCFTLKNRSAAGDQSLNELLAKSLLEDVLDSVFRNASKPTVEIVVLHSDCDDEASVLREKKTHCPSKNASSSNSLTIKMKASQVRKRPRRVIRESPPSDDEEEGSGVRSSSLEIHRIRETQSLSSLKRSAEASGSRAISSGSSKSLSQGHVHINRRRIQLRTPQNNGRKNRLRVGGETIDDKLINELTAVAVGHFEKVPLIEDGYKKIIDWIGGEVSEKRLAKFRNCEESDSLEKLTEKQGATVTKKRPRALKTSIVINDESPPDDELQKSDTTIDLVNNDCEIVEVREADRPIRTQEIGNSGNAASGKTHPLFDAVDLPTKIFVPTPCIPRHYSFLDRCATDLDISHGVEEDDKKLIQDYVQFKDWLYSAEYIDLGDEARECIQNSLVPNVIDGINDCVRLLGDACVLSHLAIWSDLDTSRLRSIVGICSRFLGSEQSKNLLGSFFELLLKSREQQQAKGQDSLVYLGSKAHGSSKTKHELLQFVWIGLMDACRRFTDSNSSSLLWTLFNEKWLKNSDRMPIQSKDPLSYKAVDSAADKLLISLRAVGCLFAFSISPSDSCSVAPVVLNPNWDAVAVVVEKIASRDYDSVESHREVLSSFLRKICFQFADKFWKVCDKFVVQVLDAVKGICAKYDEPCSCTKLHSFLTQFNSIGDLRARRRSLQDFLQTDCECASFLAWVSVAQEEQVSSKLSAKILQHNSQFLRAKGVVKEPARALTHHLGLTLAISDCIVKGRGGQERVLRSMLFSKVPSVTRAVENPLNFDTRIVESWSAVLETVNLRCRHLLASGQSIHVYSDYIFENMFATLKCVEKPESLKPVSVEERESRRVQQSVLVKLMVRMLMGFADIVKLVVQHVDGGHYSNFEAVESLLFSLSKFVKRLGKFSVGLISQIRSNSIGGSALSRQEVLLAILAFVEQGLALCTVRIRQRKRVSDQRMTQVQIDPIGTVEGCTAFSKQVQCEMMESFASMVRSPVFESAPKLDVDVRLSASRALARTIGLSCIGSNAIYSAHNANDLLGIIMRAKMPVLGGSSSNAAAMATVENPDSIDEQARIILELMMQTEFWSIILDDVWSQAVLSLSSKFSEIIFGLWILLLVVSHSQSTTSDLAKALPKLSDGIQKTTRFSTSLANWFKEASSSCNEIAITDNEFDLMKVDQETRLETLTMSFSIIVSSWPSAQVYDLVRVIRRFIGISSKRMNDKYEAFNASQRFWRTSRDIEDGEIALLDTQVLAVLFVVESSLSSTHTPSRFNGARARIEKSVSNSYLIDITDSLTKALNKLRKKENEKAQSRIQLLVVTGLATNMTGLNDVQTSVSFQRFLRLCGNGDSLANLITWNDETKIPRFMQRAPFMVDPRKTRDEKERQHYVGIQRRSRKVREVALSTLVELPIQRKASDTLEFRAAIERFCRLLRQRGIVTNLRNTGIWPNICQVLASIGRRGNEVQREKVREALPADLEQTEAMYLKTLLRTRD